MNIVLCGVGGQGVLLASEVLAQAALRAGFDVKKSEVHGMAQRGGSVVSHVRYGEKVHSPLVGEGQADVVLALEQLEARAPSETMIEPSRLAYRYLEPMRATVEYARNIIELNSADTRLPGFVTRMRELVGAGKNDEAEKLLEAIRPTVEAHLKAFDEKLAGLKKDKLAPYKEAWKQAICGVDYWKKLAGKK